METTEKGDLENALIFPNNENKLYIIRSKLSSDVLSLNDDLPRYGQVLSWDKKNGDTATTLLTTAV